MDLSKIFDKTIGGGGGVNMIQFCAVFVGFGDMYFLYQILDV